GDYFVVVANSFGAVTSAIAPVTVVRYLPTGDVTAAMGARVSFSILKVGRPITVRWFKDGQPLREGGLLQSDFYETILRLSAVNDSSAGQYCMIASNQWGEAHAPCTTLTVVPAGPLDALHPIGTLPPGQFYNLEWHNGLFVAAGAYQIATSTNGSDWSSH